MPSSGEDKKEKIGSGLPGTTELPVNPLDRNSGHTSSATAKYLRVERENLCAPYWLQHARHCSAWDATLEKLDIYRGRRPL